MIDVAMLMLGGGGGSYCYCLLKTSLRAKFNLTNHI